MESDNFARAIWLQGVPNFRQVAPGLYAGAQPTPEGIWNLAALEVNISGLVNPRTVLVLTDSGEYVEAQGFAAQGIQVHSIPLPGIAIFDTMPREKIYQALAIVMDQSQRPLFINCIHGEDRTGLIVACYRIITAWLNGTLAVETLDGALNEMIHFGDSWVQIGMRDFVKDFYARMIALPAGTPIPWLNIKGDD
jgi:tyrosine-protein phosphatase SIW14